MLAQIATLTGVDLSAGIIEVVILDEGAELRSPIVVGAGDDLPGKIAVAFPATGAKAAARCGDVEAGGFRKVNADACAGVWLKFAKRESPNEIRHERTSVNKASRAAVSQDSAIRQGQGSISPTPKAVVKEVPFKGRTKYTGAKDITELDAPEKADVIFWVNGESVSKLVLENSGSAPVLINVGAHIDCSVKARPIINGWWRRRCDLLIFRRGRPGK